MENPSVPPIRNIRWPVRTVERVLAVSEDTAIKDRERGLPVREPDIVVTLDEQVTTDRFHLFDRILAGSHVHCDIAKMDNHVVGFDRLEVPVEKCGVHVPDGGKRSVAVFDDIRVPEVVVGDNETTHHSPVTSDRL